MTGTTRLRTHVDVDTLGGLVPLQGVMAAARDCADIAEVQLIAFPQEGLLRDPGAVGLMAQAMDEGLPGGRDQCPRRRLAPGRDVRPAERRPRGPAALRCGHLA